MSNAKVQLSFWIFWMGGSGIERNKCGPSCSPCALWTVSVCKIKSTLSRFTIDLWPIGGPVTSFYSTMHCVKSVRIRSFLVRIFSNSNWIRTRKTTNTDTFHAMMIMYETNEREAGIIKDTKTKQNYVSVKFVILENALALVFSSKYRVNLSNLDIII